ncbi:GPI transamidase component PIG-S-like [Zophobas morio]|uniref:GPI transamidase component PIG-S-like n=1 Tax=Zophobas morio TaxID=2755281 RepID=UPI00308341D6
MDKSFNKNTESDWLNLTLEANSLDIINSIFARQLRELFGISRFKRLHSTTYVDAPEYYINTWEADIVQRRKNLENIWRTKSYLSSLFTLNEFIPNFVEEDISDHITKSLSFLNSSIEYLGYSSFVKALNASQEALKFAKQATFQPSLKKKFHLVELNLHLVISPLLVPIIASTVSSLFKILLKFKR